MRSIEDFFTPVERHVKYYAKIIRKEELYSQASLVKVGLLLHLIAGRVVDDIPLECTFASWILFSCYRKRTINFHLFLYMILYKLYYDKFDCSYSFQSSRTRFMVHVIIIYYTCQYIWQLIGHNWQGLLYIRICLCIFPSARCVSVFLCHHLFLLSTSAVPLIDDMKNTDIEELSWKEMGTSFCVRQYLLLFANFQALILNFYNNESQPFEFFLAFCQLYRCLYEFLMSCYSAFIIISGLLLC